MKSLKECIRILVQVVGGDGNLLLNVGPMPDGRIQPRRVERLREIGQWLKKHGEAIYGTRGGPFKPEPWYALTHRIDKIYLHVLDWPEKTLLLPPPSMQPSEQLSFSAAVMLSGTRARKGSHYQ